MIKCHSFIRFHAQLFPRKETENVITCCDKEMDWGLVTFYDCSKDLGQPTGMEEMFNLQESEASAVLICF